MASGPTRLPAGIRTVGSGRVAHWLRSRGAAGEFGDAGLGIDLVHAGGTDKIPIAAPRPTLTRSAAEFVPPPAPGRGEHITAALPSAAALLRALRWLSAKSSGADSELNLDSAPVADSKDVSKVASGETDSAPSASEMVEITCRPVVMTSGAAVRAQLRDGEVTPAGAGSAAGGGESNGVSFQKPAEARA